MSDEKPTLQTKLKDLESMLDDAILCGPQKHWHEDIQQKFTSIVSCDSTQFTQKLESLRKSFNDRDTTFRIFSNPEFDKDSISNSSSTCSATLSCMNGNEGEEVDDSSRSIVFNNPAMVELRGGNVKEKEIVESDCCLKEEKNKKEKVKCGFGNKNSCVLLTIGVGIGTILMGFVMLNISGCFENVGETNSAFPT